MSCCIYSDSFYNNILNIEENINSNSIQVNTELLSSLIPAFNPEISGVWQPIVIKFQNINKFGDILVKPKFDFSPLNPCNCKDISTDQDFSQKNLDCEYCNKTQPINHSVTWTISDTRNDKTYPGNFVSSYCEGGRDVRSYPDDYLSKIPSLSNVNLNNVYDFKNLPQEFPAINNPGLGWENFISIPVNQTNFRNLAGSSIEVKLDWILKERIGELEPSGTADDSYENIEHHKKAYSRFRNYNKTCGNFILLAPDATYDNKAFYPEYPQLDNSLSKIINDSLNEEQLPSPESFTIPYGQNNNTYYNIFSSGDTKLASHWKWNYTSGIIGWYRYSDIDPKPNQVDTRIVPGVDLYISDGDVFFAKNHGPENSTNSADAPNGVKTCPSGIKCVSRSGTIDAVIPNNSEFVYISQNIYDKAHNLFYKINDLEKEVIQNPGERKSPKQKFEIACLLATSPDYDEITVDLLKNNASNGYDRDIYFRITSMNSDMSSKNRSKSANTLNFIKNKKDLFNTLVNKYGLYMWFKPNSVGTVSISLDSFIKQDPSNQNVGLSFDLDFEPVIDISDKVSNTSASGMTNCAATTITKQYYYDQLFKCGNLEIKTQQTDAVQRLDCIGNSFAPSKGALTSSVLFQNTIFKTLVYSTGSINFQDVYLRPVSYDLALDIAGEVNLCSINYLCNRTLAVKFNNENNTLGGPLEYREGTFQDDSVKLMRGYPASFFNPNIDLCAFHKDGGVYFDSNVFGKENLVFKKSATVGNSLDNLLVSFQTKQIGIKLYSLNIEKIRDQNNLECRTIPLDKACKCFPIQKINDSNYPNSCGRQIFSNAQDMLYTPNISTHNIPNALSYGGYAAQEITEKFGLQNPVIIPNHPGYGASLPVLEKTIDPLNPYECYKSISIQLPSYIHTIWNLGLDKYLTNNHADIWAIVNEQVDLFSRTIVVDPEDNPYDPITSALGIRREGAGGATLGGLFGINFDIFGQEFREAQDILRQEQEEVFEFLSNPNFRRYTNSVTILDKPIFNRQTKKIVDASQTIVPIFFNIDIKNPFLFSLLNTLGESNKQYYTPLPCYADRISVGTPLSSVFSKYQTNVNITFFQEPRKHLLLYQLHPLKNTNALSLMRGAFFHPNSGLVLSSNSQTSLLFNKNKCYYDFDYERKFLTNQENYSNDGLMYAIKLDKSHQVMFDIIDSLKNHKKLRLYLQTSRGWYEYVNPHIFGFYNKYNNQLYPGAATFFEYTNFDKSKILLQNRIPTPLNQDKNILITKPSVLIPASPKINTKFNFLYGTRHIDFHQKHKFNLFTHYQYPYMTNEFSTDTTSSRRGIQIKTIRPYFLIDEEPNFLELATLGVPFIENLSPQQQEIESGTIILDDNDNFWKYENGPKNQYDSYQILSDYSYYENNFSSSDFSFKYNDTKSRILNNSLKVVKPGTFINLYDSQDTLLLRPERKQIIGKYISIKYVDEKGIEIKDINNSLIKKYMEVHTCFILDSAPIVKKGVYSLDSDQFYLVIYQDFQHSLKLERSEELVNNPLLYRKREESYFDGVPPDINILKQSIPPRHLPAPYATKWGDLLNYDFNTTVDLNNSPYLQNFIDSHYPIDAANSNKYANIFDNILINNFNIENYIFYLKYNVANEASLVPGQSHSMQLSIQNNKKVFFTQHQKYHSLVDYISEIDLYENQENFLPFFDLNIVDPDNNAKQLKPNNINNIQNYSSTTGVIFISGVRQFVTSGILEYQSPHQQNTGVVQLFNNPFINPADDSYMILALDLNASVRPILFDRAFYHTTLRVDEPYFPLRKIEFLSAFSTDQACSSFSSPQLKYKEGEYPVFFNGDLDQISDNINRSYFRFPIYCDTDKPGELCGNESCSYRIAGATDLKAEYQHWGSKNLKFRDIANADSMTPVWSLDEGLYNSIHGDFSEFPYIQRFEIPSDDSIFNDPNSNEGLLNWFNNNVEDRKINPKVPYINTEYQNELLRIKNLSLGQTALVNNTDIWANEMLFRTMYGSSQKINTDTIKRKTLADIAKANNEFGWSDLLQYKENPTTPDKIYSLIPYDYSPLSDQSRRKISGSISIFGIPSIGTNFSVSINNRQITFGIEVDEKGNVNLNMAGGGFSAQTKLGSTFTISENLLSVATDANGQLPNIQTPPGSTLTKLGVCVGGRASKSWSPAKYFTKLSFEREDGDGNSTTIDVGEELKKCVAAMNNDGCVGNTADIDDIVISHQVTFPGTICPFTCPTCSSRGWADSFTPPPGCEIIQSTVGQVNWGSFSRGTFANDVELGIGCAARVGAVQLSPALKEGSFDSAASTKAIIDMKASSNCQAANLPCKSYCQSVDASDKNGPISDIFRIGAFSSIYGTPCECQSFSYDYCSVKSTPCDPCLPYYAGYPKNFAYQFENMYSRFVSRGHILAPGPRDPIVSNGVVVPAIGCDTQLVDDGPRLKGAKGSERCMWIQCSGPEPPSFHIFNQTTITQSAYNPTCPIFLTNISYNNHTTTVSAGSATICFSNVIKNDCPVININLPNNFTFVDSIDSECSSCDVEPNKVRMTIQNPDWNLIEEERTVILGVSPPEGEINEDLVSGGGVAWASNSVCNPFAVADCCLDGCYKADGAVGYQCGKSAPDSWAWKYVLNCELNGSSDPLLGKCPAFGGILTNARNGVGFETGASNKPVSYAQKAYWESLMEDIYSSIAACNRFLADVPLTDIVEGIIPGSCSKLQYREVLFPATAYRQTIDGGETRSINYTVTVAYYTHKYRRPKTINDLALGEDIAPKCSALQSNSSIGFLNVSEKYGTRSDICQNTPSCYDKVVPDCSPQDFCCQTGKPNRGRQ